MWELSIEEPEHWRTGAFKLWCCITLYAKQKKRHRCTDQTLGLWEKARVGCSERIALKLVYYQGWNRSPAQVGCMRPALGPGALGRPRGIGWRERWEGGSRWGTHVNPWLIHFSVWQNPLQYCKELMLLNCGVGEDSWESLGQQGDQTSLSLRRSTLNIHSWFVQGPERLMLMGREVGGGDRDGEHM